jgi:hypothetical protein
LLYHMARDWTPAHTAKVRRHVDRRTCSHHQRDARIEEYWSEPTDADAAESVRRLTMSLLWGDT